MSDRMIHLVGSIPFRTPAEVFERVGSILGPRLYSIPDGETGERLGWMGWLEPIFAAHPQLESTGQTFTPRASGSEITGKYRVKAGVSVEDVEIEIQGSVLSIIGARKDRSCAVGVSFHQMEITYSRFEKTLQFPSNIEGARIEHNFEDGILIIRLWA